MAIASSCSKFVFFPLTANLMSAGKRITGAICTPMKLYNSSGGVLRGNIPTHSIEKGHYDNTRFISHSQKSGPKIDP